VHLVSESESTRRAVSTILESSEVGIQQVYTLDEGERALTGDCEVLMIDKWLLAGSSGAAWRALVERSPSLVVVLITMRPGERAVLERSLGERITLLADPLDAAAMVETMKEALRSVQPQSRSLLHSPSDRVSRPRTEFIGSAFPARRPSAATRRAPLRARESS
jgi:DNA-binding NtrC family response regulator